VGLLRNIPSETFSTLAPREKTMGRKSGREGGMPFNSPFAICRGVRPSSIGYGLNTGPVGLASGHVP